MHFSRLSCLCTLCFWSSALKFSHSRSDCRLRRFQKCGPGWSHSDCSCFLFCFSHCRKRWLRRCWPTCRRCHWRLSLCCWSKFHVHQGSVCCRSRTLRSWPHWNSTETWSCFSQWTWPCLCPWRCRFTFLKTCSCSERQNSTRPTKCPYSSITDCFFSPSPTHRWTCFCCWSCPDLTMKCPLCFCTSVFICSKSYPSCSWCSLSTLLTAWTSCPTNKSFPDSISVFPTDLLCFCAAIFLQTWSLLSASLSSFHRCLFNHSLQPAVSVSSNVSSFP